MFCGGWRRNELENRWNRIEKKRKGKRRIMIIMKKWEERNEIFMKEVESWK